MLNLDHNATTPLLPEAAVAMLAAGGGNPSSSHALGRQARRTLEDAREEIAALLGASPEEVVFTSGSTEANNLALFGLAGEPPGRIVASPLEHPCIIEPLKMLAKRGFAVEWLPVDRRGIVQSSASDARLTAVMLANHETGAIQPVRALVGSGHFHTDAAQAVGKIPVSFRELGVTSLSASAHKFCGPVGVGLLLLKAGTPFAPLTHGGHQQRGRRPGTEPAMLAVGMCVALRHAVAHMRETAAHLTHLRNVLLAELEARVPLVVNGPRPGDGDSLPTTLNVSFPGHRGDVLLMKLDLAGVACSTGSACSSGSLLPSPVLAAMGVPDDVLRGAVRFSVGAGLTEDDMRTAAARVAACIT